MLESKSYDSLLKEALSMGAALGVDTRQGSVYFDAAAGHCFRMAKFYSDLVRIASITKLETATGESLDYFGDDHNMERNEATAAKWTFQYTGTTPEPGTRFFVNDMYFTLVKQGGVLYLAADEKGAKANAIIPGSGCVPFTNITGLLTAKAGVLVDEGVDSESDDSFRSRIKAKIHGSAENGNKQHYKMWCEEVAGVGRAKIYPLWAGPNTVKAVIVNTDGQPPLPSLIEKVQDYVDPVIDGYRVIIEKTEYVHGDGLGEGVANMGAHFIAVGAEGYAVDIEFTVILTEGSSLDKVRQETRLALQEELEKIALKSMDSDSVTIRYNTIGTILYGLSSVLDYEKLRLNGRTENIIIGADQIAVLGEVNINVL